MKSEHLFRVLAYPAVVAISIVLLRHRFDVEDLAIVTLIAALVLACEIVMSNTTGGKSGRARLSSTLVLACISVPFIDTRPLVTSVEASSVPELRRTMEEVTWLRTA